MDEALLKKATERANQDVAERNRRKALPKPRTIGEVSAERRAEKDLEAIAPKTGYPDLDQIIRGFIPGHLYTLTGNENVGKTSLACNFAVRVALQGKKVLYFALEPENMVVDYIASVRYDKRFEDVTQEDTEFDDGMIHIYGKEEVSKIEDLVEIVNTLPRYDLVIIDHIGYFVSGQANWLQEQSNAIKRLAGLSKAKQCAIMMIAHMRKRPIGAKKSYVPGSDDIAGSGAFKQDSTEVLIVVRKLQNPEGDGMEYSDEGILYVTKTKAGPNGSINLQFQERKANIVSLGEAIEKARAINEARGEFTKVTAQTFQEADPDVKW